jgi:predicted ATP-binding protein involved in virulence
MRIDEIRLKNFRGFDEIQIKLNPNFNLIVGDNGSGKTAILEALTVAMGSFFLGLKNTDSRNIRMADIRLKAYENSEEFQYPVEIESVGYISGIKLNWIRSLNSQKGNTLLNQPYMIKRLSETFDEKIRNGELFTLPVLAYYPTGRLWKDLVERKRKGQEKKIVASRLRAYKSCLQATLTFKIFVKWFEGKERSSFQKREEDISLRIIRSLLIRNIPDCKNLYYEYDLDKVKGLKIEQLDGGILPFEYLSDGIRNLIALLADIAYSCLVLNPHLKESTLLETPGIVLIDELDLHLHPEWQKLIVQILKKEFPAIQFITSSHSPFLIQEMEEGQLIKLKNNTVSTLGGDQMSIEDIAEYVQEVDNPQWSEKKKDLYDVAEEYYKALESGSIDEELEMKMAALVKPFSQNPAFDAFIQQQKLLKEKKDETNN